MARYLVTSGLPYSNGRLHVGHIGGAYLPADTYVRYLRMCGHDVRFVCGSDDHGVPVLLTAREEGVSPQDVVAKYNASQKAAFDALGIKFDIYGSTSRCPHHVRLSQQFFKTLYDKGYMEKVASQQLYDPVAGMFLPDRYVKGTCHHCGAPDALGDQCEACGRVIDPLKLKDPVSVITGTTPEVRTTAHWFFDLQRFSDTVREWLDTHPQCREVTRNFVRGLLDAGLPKRAMTRDLDWGVPVPLDDPDAAGKVLYVWFDAPIGYVSFTAELCEREGGSPDDYERWWKDPDCRIVHFIGEDNTVFHCIIWIAMLAGEGSFQLPYNIVVNSFMNIRFPGRDVEKISKSRGTAIWIDDFLKDHEPDSLRYYLTSIAPETARGVYVPGDLVTRNNTELAAALGNFFHRVFSFTHKYLGGAVPEPAEMDDLDRAHIASAEDLGEQVGSRLEACRFRDALGALMEFARASNKYFDTRQPWATRKTDAARTATTIYVCLRSCRALLSAMAPFLPFGAEKAARMFGEEVSGLRWGQSAVEPGRSLGKPEVLFKYIEEEPA